VSFVPYGDAAALADAVTDVTASVVLEPVMGEVGVVVPPDGYLEAARAACDARGALLHLDEVQGGIGRAGDWLACRVVAPSVQPDLVTLAKGLGGGLPLGAVVARGPAAAALQKGDHGTTFGGNPVSCAAGLAVLEVLEAEQLPARAAAAGARLTTQLLGLGHDLLGGVRGLGLWLGLVLTEPVAARAEVAARAAGFIVNACAPDVLRLAPPLVVTEDQLDAFVASLPGILDAARVAA
jgi:acetylornithine aminotransferase